ncbi:hypothetical protein Tco_1533890 [Tanacetum coccineum]
MGCHFYNPHENKVSIAHLAELFRNSLKCIRSEWESHSSKSEWEFLALGMAFGGNTRDLGSFGEETDKIMDLHQILEEILLTRRGDGVASIKRHRRDPSTDSDQRFSDGIRNMPT